MRNHEKENQKPVRQYSDGELMYMQRQVRKMQRDLSLIPHPLQATAAALRLMELDNYVGIKELPNELMFLVKHFTEYAHEEELMIYGDSIKALINVTIYFNDLNAMRAGYW